MDTKNLKLLEKKIKVNFTDKYILKKALTHRSYINEHKDGDTLESNERLEFLGDAVLQFITSEYIFKKYPKYPEGELTNLRSRLVNTDSLAEESARLEFSKYLYISKGEQQTAYESNYILADTFEAILGAIYLDKGMDTCTKFIKRELLYKTEKIIKQGDLKDFKSQYQEYAQEKFGTTPSYKVLSDTGPDHNKTFEVGLFLDNKLIASGTGVSKRKAQQEAAEKALKLVTKPQH